MQKLLGILTPLSDKLQALVGGAGSMDRSKMVIIFPLLIIFIVGLTVGKSRTVIALLSLYVAAVLTAVFPFTDSVKDMLSLSRPELVSGVILLIFFVAVLVIFHHSFLQKRLSTADAPILSVALVMIVEIGFLLSIAFSLGIFRDQGAPFDQLRYIFGTNIAKFVWAVIPLVTLMFVKREKRGTRSSSTSRSSHDY